MVADARRGVGPLRHARSIMRTLLSLRMPMIRPLWAFFYAERELRHELLPILLKILYREPLMRYRCARIGRRLNLEGAIPLIYGDGSIEIGDDVRIGGRNTWNVGFKVSTDARLVIGDRVNIGYQNVLSVASRITIGNDTIFAPNVQVYDNIAHPLEPDRRLRREPFSLDEASPVTIGSNVWLGANCFVMRGVTIGDGSIVAAASVVTRDVPPNTLVAGNPAKPIKQLVDSPASIAAEPGGA